MPVSIGTILLIGAVMWLLGIVIVVSLLYAFGEREQSETKADIRT